MKTPSRPHANDSIQTSLTAAIDAIRNAAQNLRAQIDAKASERNALAEKIRQLSGLPVCFEDWLPSLKAYIHACGQEAAPGDNILHVRGPYTRPFNERAENVLGGGTMLFHEVICGAPDRENASAFGMLCFYFPEVVFARLSEHYRQAVGKAWGNEDLPRVEERVRQREELSAKVQALDEDLAVLHAELAKLPALSDEQAPPAPVFTGEPQALDMQAES